MRVHIVLAGMALTQGSEGRLGGCPYELPVCLQVVTDAVHHLPETAPVVLCCIHSG
jgi:hypothetical protein